MDEYVTVFLDKEKKYKFDIDKKECQSFLEAWDMLLITANLLGYNYYFEFQIYSKYNNFDVNFSNNDIDSFFILEFDLTCSRLFYIRLLFDDDLSKTFYDLTECLKRCQKLL